MSDTTPPERVKVVFAPNGNIRLFTTGDIPASLAELPVYEYVLASALEASEARAAAAERERDELRAAQQWQPIETAPKDGSPFLAAVVCQSMHGTEWWDMSVAEWDSDRELFCDRFALDVDGFTHWQPLPAPPQPR